MDLQTCPLQPDSQLERLPGLGPVAWLTQAHKFEYWSLVSGTIWEGLKSMALFGRCVTGGRLEVSGLRLVDGDVSSQQLFQHHACLPACCYVLHQDGDELLSLWSSKPQINPSFSNLP